MSMSSPTDQNLSRNVYISSGDTTIHSSRTVYLKSPKDTRKQSSKEVSINSPKGYKQNIPTYYQSISKDDYRSSFREEYRSTSVKYETSSRDDYKKSKDYRRCSSVPSHASQKELNTSSNKPSSSTRKVYSLPLPYFPRMLSSPRNSSVPNSNLCASVVSSNLILPGSYSPRDIRAANRNLKPSVVSSRRKNEDAVVSVASSSSSPSSSNLYSLPGPSHYISPSRKNLYSSMSSKNQDARALPLSHLATLNDAYAVKKIIKEVDSPLSSNLIDCRSTAAQFFVEEAGQETSNMIIRLLYEARASDQSEKLEKLSTVKEILFKEPKLIEIFLGEVIYFHCDTQSSVLYFLINFIREVCVCDNQLLPKVIDHLLVMLQKDIHSIQMNVLRSVLILYPDFIRLINAKHVNYMMQTTWEVMTRLKQYLYSLLESNNEGIRTYVIKFMEIIVLIQTFKDKFSNPDNKDLSLDAIPLILKVIQPRKLEQEAKEIFQRLVDLHGATHVSSCNLMVCMQVLSKIAKKRLEFFPKVLQAFASLLGNLPPTLSQSQVTLVRKLLNFELFTLVKHPGAVEFRSQLSILLSNFGVTAAEINKCFPCGDSSKKRANLNECQEISVKKNKISESFLPSQCDIHSSSSRKEKSSHATAEDLRQKIHNQNNVADLVLVSMLNLPTTMPSNFQSTFIPIATADTEHHINHLSRLLATRLTISGLGKDIEDVKTSGLDNKREISNKENDSASNQIKTVSCTMDYETKEQPIMLLPSRGSSAKICRSNNRIDFNPSINPFTDEEAEGSVYARILNAEKLANKGASQIRTKLLTNMATKYRGNFAKDSNHIMENPRSGIDLAFSWIYKEYSTFRGFEVNSERSLENYEETVNTLLCSFMKSDVDKYATVSKFFYQVPYITNGMIEFLKTLCTDEKTASEAVHIAYNMIIRESSKGRAFLGIICNATLHENFDVRTVAVSAAVDIHKSGHMCTVIEMFALQSLKFLLHPIPPVDYSVFYKTFPVTWNETLTKICLQLYLSLLPMNHSLIHDLGKVYTNTFPLIKCHILRALKIPVKDMSMASPELLLFLETFPEGCETLIIRIIHILTDKNLPSTELVARVRNLYRKRVPNIEFLVPIINGLTKQEIISALPELIQLKSTVVKEVFHRLLGSSFPSPVSHTELLVALHNIKLNVCDLKIITKAISLCLEEKTVYTQVILAVVIQELLEQDPLPILLMGTIIRSVSIYPHLVPFSIHILQRLIVKKVWTQKTIWQGFVKYCQQIKPRSSRVLLQLPAKQLEEVLSSCPDLQDPLFEYVELFNEQHKAALPKGILKILTSFKSEKKHPAFVKDKSLKGDDYEEGGESPT